MKTDNELKLKLAKELPELIGTEQYSIRDGKTFWSTTLKHSFRWLDTGKEVTEREWDWVVDKVIYNAWIKSQVKASMTYADTFDTWQQRAEL
jgi:hypothetical protein